MPIEIKELLVRAIWGSTPQDEMEQADNAGLKKSNDVKEKSEDEMLGLQASLKRMLDQSQER